MSRSADSGAPFRYRAFGLSIASSFPLTELEVDADPDAPDVTIRRGSVDSPGENRPEWLQLTPAGALLDVAEAARYLIRDGREIVVQQYPSGSDRHMRLFLLGSAFGVVLHQRSILPLHANAMVLGEGAAAFMGASGAGKSTMAAWFHDRGYAVLSDDVCAVTCGDDGLVLAQPGIPRLRLWRDALEATGRDVAAHEHAFDDADKYNVRTAVAAGVQPRPLAAVYLLDDDRDPAKDFSISRLSGLDAAEALIANTYRGGYLSILGGKSRHLAACARVAGTTPIYRVTRRWGRAHLAEQMRQLEQHAADHSA